MRLIRKSLSLNVWAKLTFDAKTVICRFCSRSHESRNSFCPAVCVLIMPAAARRLSERVVFPWSTWAIMLVFLMTAGLFISLTISSTCLYRAITKHSPIYPNDYSTMFLM